MSREFAQFVDVSIVELPKQFVELADRSQQPVVRTRELVRLSINAHYSEDLHFTLARSIKYDIILGLPWLESGNKYVDWKKRTISFIHAGAPVTPEAGKPFKRAL